MSKHLRRYLPAFLICVFSAPVFSADAIADWNERTVALVTEQKLLPPQAEREMACVHIAMFDAVNSIDRRYRPYRHAVAASKNASKEAAAAVAAATVLIGLHPDAAEKMNSALAAYLAKIPQDAAKSEGMKIGMEIAARTLADREKDGSAVADAYRPKTKPGVYVPTPITASSMWPGVKPFVMTNPTQFRPPPPPALGSREWATDYNEIRRLGGKNSTQRSARQTEDARFWLITGPSSYYPIVRQLAAAKKMDLVDSARYMALVSVATADAFIAVFDGKYHYDFWRPITAIRNGDIDGNVATEREATWQPLDNTPMHPEYPCAHCITAAAVATVSEAVLGGANVPEVAMTSATAPGITHRWTNLWTYADEVSVARVYAGFHYRFSTRIGQDMGRKIGQFAVQSAMQPADAR